MTAGLSTRHVAPHFTAHTALAPLLPATGFRVDSAGAGRFATAVPTLPVQARPAHALPVQAQPVQALPAQAQPVLDLPEQAVEGESDNRVLIDTLVAGAVNGDPRARDELLKLIHPLVLKYCRARLGRQESLMGSADDVAQDVCMAVVSALPNYQLKGLSFRAFVYGIAAHKVTDAFRAIGRNRAEPVADLPDGPVTADGPEHRLLAAEMSARLGALLGHLTARQREVLVLRLAVGLSAEETAQAVRSTPGAVRVTQHRALGRLRRILLGETAARVLDDPTTGDLAPGETVVDPGPADDSAFDAMAAFLDGRVPEQVTRRPVPRRRS